MLYSKQKISKFVSYKMRLSKARQASVKCLCLTHLSSVTLDTDRHFMTNFKQFRKVHGTVNSDSNLYKIPPFQKNILSSQYKHSHSGGSQIVWELSRRHHSWRQSHQVKGKGWQCCFQTAAPERCSAFTVGLM